MAITTTTGGVTPPRERCPCGLRSTWPVDEVPSRRRPDASGAYRALRSQGRRIGACSTAAPEQRQPNAFLTKMPAVATVTRLTQETARARKPREWRVRQGATMSREVRDRRSEDSAGWRYAPRTSAPAGCRRPCGRDVPLHTLLDDRRAARLACSRPEQLVASNDWSRWYRNTAGNSLARCLAKRLASGEPVERRKSISSSEPGFSSRPRSQPSLCRVRSPFRLAVAHVGGRTGPGPSDLGSAPRGCWPMFPHAARCDVVAGD